MDFFLEMGPFRYPLITFTILILFNIFKHGLPVMQNKIVSKKTTEVGIDSIIFWGIMSVTTGILGQIIGIYSALGEIAKAKEISPQIIMYGFKISFTTTVYGFYVFLLSAFVWYILKRKFKQQIEEK